MSNRTTQKEIEEFLNNKTEIERLLARNEELRKQIIKDTDKHGTKDSKNENKITWTTKGFTCIVNHIHGKRFNQKRFSEEQEALYKAYKDDYTEDRLSAKANK